MKDRDNWHLTDRIEHEQGAGDPFAAAVRATRMPMIITDPAQVDNPIIFCNEAFQQLTGYGRDEILGRNCRFLQGPDTDPAAVAEIRDAITAGTDIGIDILNYRKDGTTFWNALYLSPVRNQAGDTQFFFASQLDVTNRIDAQNSIADQKAEMDREVAHRTAALEAALEEKTLLIHEVDHRVKNNLTMIGSLLRLHTRTIEDPAISERLESMIERIDALAAVHRRLYQADDIRRFDVGAFAHNLASDVVGASGRDGIDLVLDIEPIWTSSQNASAVGLIVNELMTNAIKHGFAGGRQGILKLSTRRHGSQAEVTIADDGPGLGSDAPGDDGLGTTLVRRLARQIGGTVAWKDALPGTSVTLSFTEDAA